MSMVFIGGGSLARKATVLEQPDALAHAA